MSKHSLYGLYQHYQDKKRYFVLNVTRDDKIQDNMVSYFALSQDSKSDPGRILVMAQSRFLEKVIVDGKKVPKFEPVKDLTQKDLEFYASFSP